VNYVIHMSCDATFCSFVAEILLTSLYVHCWGADVCRQPIDGFGLVKAKLQGAIRLLACLLDVVLVEATHVLSLVRNMAETLAVSGLDILRVAAAGQTLTSALANDNRNRLPTLVRLTVF